MPPERIVGVWAWAVYEAGGEIPCIAIEPKQKKERKECKQVTLVKWLIAGELLDIQVVFLKKHSSRRYMALPNKRIWPLDLWKISFYYMDLGSLGSLGPVWHGSTPELQQLQQKFQPNTPAPKLLGAANSMEL